MDDSSAGTGRCGPDGKSLTLAPVLRLKIGSAKIAIPPFNTNAIRFDEMLGNDMYVLLNAATAKNLI